MTAAAPRSDRPRVHPDALPLGNSAFEATGFEIGWDHAHYRRVPPPEHLHVGNPVRQGWQAGQNVYGTRTLRATRHVRQWLQLRLDAWRRGRAFEGVQVTPNFLKQIEVGECPVTRAALTHAHDRANDAMVACLNDGAGYAAGNLAVMSPRAHAAKAQHGWADALACARRIETGEASEIGGLDANAWHRLALLMSFTTPLAHEQVASLPLVLLPPNRLRVLNAAQALQVVLTLQFTQAGAPRRIADFAALMLEHAVREAFQVFMHTLLARRVAAGVQLEGAALRRALEDAWTHPLVQRRWERLALQLTAAQCEGIVQRAQQRGLMSPACRWLLDDVATEGWALQTRGYVAADMHAHTEAPGEKRYAEALPQVTPQASRPGQAALFA